jgi:hypothetical protein
MRNQLLLYLVFIFLLQCALLSLKYVHFENYELNLIEWKEEWISKWHNFNVWNDSFLIFLPILVYHIIKDCLKKYRPYFPAAVIDETAFHVVLVFLLHPIQLQSLFQSTVNIEFFFILFSYSIFKYPGTFKDFSVLSFILFALAVALVGFCSCQQFLWGDYSSYCFGVITLLILVSQTIQYEFHPVLLFWIIAAAMGTVALGAISLTTVTMERFISVGLTVIDLSNRKLISLIIPSTQ